MRNAGGCSMAVSDGTATALVELIFKYVPPDRLKPFLDDLVLIDGNSSFRESILGVAKRVKARLKQR
jgi:hypothetical protein